MSRSSTDPEEKSFECQAQSAFSGCWLLAKEKTLVCRWCCLSNLTCKHCTTCLISLYDWAIDLSASEVLLCSHLLLVGIFIWQRFQLRRVDSQRTVHNSITNTFQNCWNSVSSAITKKFFFMKNVLKILFQLYVGSKVLPKFSEKILYFNSFEYPVIVAM